MLPINVKTQQTVVMKLGKHRLLLLFNYIGLLFLWNVLSGKKSRYKGVDSLNLHSNKNRMSKIRITKQFGFETGHALYGYDGKCKNVHGHSYKLSVTVIGSPIDDRSNVKYGMVIDFTDLKKIVKEEVVDQFDHATVFNETTPHVDLAKELISRGHHVILVDYQPTSENMVVDFSKRISSRLPENIVLFSLKLQETESSFAEWFASDN